MLGRTRLLRGEWPEAVEALDESLALIGEDGWVVFQPFPEALRAEVALRQGDPDRAIALLDHAFALGCRIGDPCWEAFAARARGLVDEAAGRRAAALVWLRDAAAHAVRMIDPYVWVHGYCLDALAAVAIADAAPDARDAVAALETLAARGDMRELVVRAALHRATLGDPSGLAAARLLGEAIDNPRAARRAGTRRLITRGVTRRACGVRRMEHSPQSFHASPDEALQAPPEEFLYLACLHEGTGVDKPDFLAVVDAEDGRIVHETPMPNVGDELHHFGWNRCSSACHGPDRSHLIVPGFRSSRIHIVNVADDPRRPRIEKVIEREELVRATG